MHRTPASRSMLRTRRMSGMETVVASPTETSATAPLRERYTEISRPMRPVNAAIFSRSAYEANTPLGCVSSYSESMSSKIVSRMPAILP